MDDIFSLDAHLSLDLHQSFSAESQPEEILHDKIISMIKGRIIEADRLVRSNLLLRRRLREA